MDTVVTGSLAYDNILDFPGRFRDHILPDKVHVLSLSFLARRMKRLWGGTAGNISYNLALLGGTPIVLSTVGEEADDYLERLTSLGVRTEAIRKITDKTTATFFGIVDREDNQIGGFYPGAMEEAVKLSLRDLNQEDIGLVVIAPNEPTAMVSYVEEVQELGRDYIYDPGQQIPRLSGEELDQAIGGARVLIGNDYEIGLILDKTGLSLSQVRRRVWLLVVTKGSRGSVLYRGAGVYEVPAVRPSRVEDPTGAGDAYRAGIIEGVVRGWDLEKTGRVASLTAVYAVENYGAQEHVYTVDDFAARYRQCFDAELEL